MLPRIALAATVVLASVLYLKSLGSAPVMISTDEARVAIQAQSIAATGRDMHGNRTPIFFRITNPLDPHDPTATWWQPTLFYLIAAVLRFAPLSEWSVRLPTALLAVLNVALMYAVARRLFGNAWDGVLAAFLLALTPAHFLFGRQAFDYFCPLTVTLVWLWCLLRSIDSEDARWPAASGVVLGVGLYTYITSWVVMPFLLMVTLVALWMSGKPPRAIAAAAAGFAVPVVAVVPWLWLHPNMPREVFADYRVKSSLLLTSRLDVYWDYYNPSYLFFSGGSNPMFATRRAGVFFLAAAILLPCGLLSIFRQPSVARAVLAVGFFFAPIPIVLAMPTDPKYFTPRELLVVPFGVLICVAGVEWLRAQRNAAARAVAAALVASVPLQFVFFARDYFTRYQEWSAYRFDSMDFRQVATAVLAADASRPIPALYLNDNLGEEKVVQCEFHLLVRRRADLWQRTSYLTPDQSRAPAIAPGSILIVAARDRHLYDAAQWTDARQMVGPLGEPAAVLLRRN